MAKQKDISPHCTESFLFKGELYRYPNKSWFLEKEREVLGFNLNSVFSESQLKIEKYNEY